MQNCEDIEQNRGPCCQVNFFSSWI